MTDIKRVAVLGAGTMGAGIAGICANAGCEVTLLDISTEAAQKGKDRLSAGRSPVVADEAILATINVGNFDEDLNTLANADWICEAIVERVDVKRDLFSRVEAIRQDGSIITTNTSGIPLRDIDADMPERLRQDIAVTHFFNPVHIMKLVELVGGSATRPEVISTLADFLGNTLGKGVVYAKDTVNFIGNRIGCFWMLAGLHHAETAMDQGGLGIEDVDALLSTPVGIPTTGLYGLIDLIGLDVMYNVGANLKANLPADDVGHQFAEFTPRVQAIFDRGQLGRKTGGGFYKLERHDNGSKSMLIWDLANEQWRAAKKVELSADENTFPALFSSDSAQGNFVRQAMAETLCYAADLVPTIADDIVNVDRAMRWGFAWQKGPFQLIDEIGAKALAQYCEQQNRPVPALLTSVMQTAEGTFYRADGEQFMDINGNYQAVV